MPVPAWDNAIAISNLKYVFVLLLAACGSNAPAPVEDRQGRSVAKSPVVASQSASRAYRVARGDTLYSIAFRYGLDFRRLAATNRIPAPYTIYPGQTLVLKESALSSARSSTSRPVVKPAQRSRPAQPTRSDSKVVSNRPANPVSRPQPATPVPATPAAPSAAPASEKPAAGNAGFVGAVVKRWRWPSTGKVVRGFSSTRHKGIDLAGQRGDPVHAVAAGKVVYAGTGILGLGELLIVKHNDIYLSAYGHNDTLLVSEGQLVETGQRIARKGSTGTDNVKLHFEIRKAGKPIDPQRVLPKR